MPAASRTRGTKAGAGEERGGGFHQELSVERGPSGSPCGHCVGGKGRQGASCTWGLGRRLALGCKSPVVWQGLWKAHVFSSSP